MILEKYEPNIVYIKGTDNVLSTLAVAVSHLEYGIDITTHKITVHYHTKALVQLFNSHIETVLQELEEFTFTTLLDLNMGYHTIGLDPVTQKMCTIILS